VDVYVAGAKDWKFGANSINVLSGTTLTIDSGATITNSGTAIGFGTALTGSTNNQVTTVTGADAIQGETNFIYDGTIVGAGADGANADLGVGLHIKTSDSGATAASGSDEFIIENGNSGVGVGMVILSATDGYGRIYFGDSGDNDIGQIMYDHTDDGMKFKTNATATSLIIDSTGAVTKPLQPAFCVKNALMSNLAITTTHTVTFSSEIFDQNADFDTTTYTFTAPVTGRYQLSCTLKIDDIDLDSDYHGGAIACSNRSIVIMSCKTPLIFNEDSNYHAWSSSALVDMDANDTAYVTFRQNAGDVMADINANESLFSGFLAC